MVKPQAQPRLHLCTNFLEGPNPGPGLTPRHNVQKKKILSNTIPQAGFELMTCSCSLGAIDFNLSTTQLILDVESTLDS